MATTKKKKTIKENIEVDGKIDTQIPTTLDQIWGDSGVEKYKTLDENEYMSYLNDLLYTDLQNHAYKIGLRPDVEPRILRERLLTEFRRHVASFRPVSSNGGNNGLAVAPSNNVRNILREGA